jgi:type I restriction enzyme S subunit
MNRELLLAHFNRINDAPDAVPRLRSFILELAVRGKLIEQDPQDEPASELISRIEKKKSKLGLTGGTTKLGTELAAHDDIPFEIPSNWIWVRLGDICSKTGSGSTPRGGKAVYQRDGVPFLRSQNVYDDGLRLDDVAYIARQTHEKMSGTAVEPGDLLLNITGGSIGRCCLVSSRLGQANVSQHVAIIRVALDGIQRYLHQLIRSPYFQSFVLSEQTGAGRGGLPKNRMDRIPVALPPFTEQNRIVAKVDELMVLCDRLEFVRAERESQRDRLTTASHHHLKYGADMDSLRRHAHFFIEHLPRLIARPDQIKQLRQTILNLAVRGQVVSQIREDESVVTLLARNDQARQMVAQEDRRADVDRQVLLAEEYKWEVPPSWDWCALADLVLFIDYRGKTPTKTERGVRLITAKNVKTGFINISPEEFLSESDYHVWMTRGFPKEGDILFTTEAPMGNAAVVHLSERFALAQRIICFRPYGAVNPDFLALQLLAEPFLSILEKAATGLTAKGIKAAKLKRLPVTIPPLAEQVRIVAKVDELMAVCDRLEVQLTSAQTDGSRLLEAVLHKALLATPAQ